MKSPLFFCMWVVPQNIGALSPQNLSIKHTLKNCETKIFEQDWRIKFLEAGLERFQNWFKKVATLLSKMKRGVLK